MRFYVFSGRRILWGGLIMGLLLIMIALLKGNPGEMTAKAISINLMEAENENPEFQLQVISVLANQKATYRIYIYHTHTYEAYDMADGNTYQPTETWRTADEDYNVVRLGRELKRALEQAGMQVTHDTTHYEMPRLSTAYSRSLVGLEKAAEEGYDLYIDLHRDSYSKNNGPNIIEFGGEKLGRFLFLIGQGTGTGFDERPDWEKNGSAAKIISDALNAQVEGLSRGVSMKSGRYNQQAATPSILIEAGNNQNTLSEMLSSIPFLTNAICAYFDTLD